MVDTNRYDVSERKLLKYLKPGVKKQLKQKFVTGQSSDQIMKNLLNMSDSDEEVPDKKTQKQEKYAKPAGTMKKKKKDEDAMSDDSSDNEEAKGGFPSQQDEQKKGFNVHIKKTREEIM